MASRVLFLLLLLVLPVGASAQCSNSPIAPVGSTTLAASDEPPVPDEIIPIEPPTAPMTTNIAFIVDTSGSMNNRGRVDMAITFANSIISTPGDQLMVSLFSFKHFHTRWPGLTPKEMAAARKAGELDETGKQPPKGWTYFPGKPQLESAQRWLNSHSPRGGTDPTSALTEALASGVDDLSIVLITDGEDFEVPEFKAAIDVGQTLRLTKGLKRATIFVIGVGKYAHSQKHLREAGKAGGGGMFVVRRPESAEDLEIDIPWDLPVDPADPWIPPDDD